MTSMLSSLFVVLVYPDPWFRTCMLNKMPRPKSFLSLLLLLGFGSALSVGLTACRQPMADMMDHGKPPTSPSSMSHDTMSHGGAMMDLGQKDEYWDLRFIDGMILHHQGAIAMAETALKQSQRQELKQLAQNIITAQQTEISQLQQWRNQWYPNQANTPMMHDAAGHMKPMSDTKRAALMMEVDLGAPDSNFDLRFIDAMVPHHEGAVLMAKQVLENSDRPELRELAQAIIAAQQPEIDQMQTWRDAWYPQPANP